MTSNKKYHNFKPELTAILLAMLIIAPLIGVPPGVGGIPVWYQDTFFYGLMSMGVIGIIAVMLYWSGRLQPVRWNAIDFGVLLLLTYMVIRTSAMEFIPQSSWIQMTWLGGAYFITRLLWPSIHFRSLSMLFSILLLAGIAQAGYGLGQLYGWWPSHHHLFSLTGTFFNPGPFSGWLACVVPIAVYSILRERRVSRDRIYYYLSWTYLILALLVIIPAASRAAMLAAITGSIIVAWPKIKETRLWKSNWAKGAIATVLMAGLVGLYLMKKDSADGRLLIYKVTADMIADKPMFGWGWDGFPRMYNNFQAVYFQNGHGSEREMYLADNVTYGFNEIMEFTAEMGIIGLLLIGLITALVLRKWQHQKRKQQVHIFYYLGISVLVSWISFALFSYPMSIPSLMLLLSIFLSGINTALNMEHLAEYNASSSLLLPSTWSGSKYVIGCLLLGVSGIALYWIIQFHSISKLWIRANMNPVVLTYENNDSPYKQLYSKLQNEGMFLQYAGKSFSIMREYFKSSQILERALFYSADPIIFTTLGKDYTLFSDVDSIKKTRAEFLLTRAKYISPHKYYPRYLLSKYYEKTGQEQKAIQEAKATMTFTPKVESNAIKQIELELSHIINKNEFHLIKKIVK